MCSSLLREKLFWQCQESIWRHFFWSCGLEMTKSWLEFHFLVSMVDFNTEAISWWRPCWKWFGDVVMTQQQHGQCSLIPAKLGHEAVLVSRKCRSGQRAVFCHRCQFCQMLRHKKERKFLRQNKEEKIVRPRHRQLIIVLRYYHHRNPHRAILRKDVGHRQHKCPNQDWCRDGKDGAGWIKWHWLLLPNPRSPSEKDNLRKISAE